MKGSSEVSEFLNYLATERGVSKNTLESYSQDLRQFLEACTRFKISPLEAELKHLRDFLASLRRNEVSERSLARKSSTLRQFFKFLMREEKIETNPSDLLSVRVATKKLPKHLSANEMIAILDIVKGETESEIRDRALLELWYATGCRVSEMVNLKVEDLDLEEGIIRITGKGGRTRLVPVHEVAIDWCQKYRLVRHEWLVRFALKEPEIFFLARHGKGFTRQGVWKNLKRYALKAGVRRKVWPHMIRHTFATHVLQGGADLRAVQELLGHRSIATTEIYTHLDADNLKEMQSKFHPRR